MCCVPEGCLPVSLSTVVLFPGLVWMDLWGTVLYTFQNNMYLQEESLLDLKPWSFTSSYADRIQLPINQEKMSDVIFVLQCLAHPKLPFGSISGMKFKQSGITCSLFMKGMEFNSAHGDGSSYGTFKWNTFVIKNISRLKVIILIIIRLVRVH